IALIEALEVFGNVESGLCIDRLLEFHLLAGKLKHPRRSGRARHTMGTLARLADEDQLLLRRR
ncbi:MAG: hypothetical protein OXI74_11585, partial [Rhodospirillaceae bacterium]|nr:hypothetical protein [Rhodospirillaceae bacterium]